MSERRHKVGLALSGGGLRGFAHVGVVKALEARGWRPDLVTGASMGGIVAAAYASGMPIDTMVEESLKLTHLPHIASLLDRRPHPNALIAGERLLQYFRKALNNAVFQNLRMPLGLLTVDCETGEQVPLLSGDVALAVRATMAFPGVFAAVEIDGRRLIDGGASDNLPVRLAKEMGAGRVVAVDVNPPVGVSMPVPAENLGLSLLPVPHVMSLLQRGFDIMVATLTELRLRECPPDALLRPQVPQEVNTFTGFDYIADCIAAGEAAVEAHVQALRPIFVDG